MSQWHGKCPVHYLSWHEKTSTEKSTTVRNYTTGLWCLNEGLISLGWRFLCTQQSSAFSCRVPFDRSASANTLNLFYYSITMQRRILNYLHPFFVTFFLLLNWVSYYFFTDFGMLTASGLFWLLRHWHFSKVIKRHIITPIFDIFY